MVPLQAIYLRCRLVTGWWRSSMNLSGPERSVNSDSFLNFGRGHYPPTNVPLRLPPLAHDLAGEVQCILRFLVQRERVNFPPLHLPSVKMVEIKGRPLVKVGVQFQDLFEIMDTWQTQECDCRMWHKEKFRTFVFTCASDSSLLSFGRFELE